MAASSTWWALPTSATAAKMMWLQWVNDFLHNWHWNLISVYSSYSIPTHKIGQVISDHKMNINILFSDVKRFARLLFFLEVVCPFVFISDMLVCCLFIYPSIALGLSVQSDNPCRAARCGGGGVVPVQGVDAKNGWEYSAEGSQRHQPGESSAGNQTGLALLMN